MINRQKTLNYDQYILHIGRQATGSSLIGIIIALIGSYLFDFNLFKTILTTLFAGYVFLTGYWGGHKMHRWFKQYRYRFRDPIWHILHVLTIIAGIIMGQVGWGFFEHFILLMAVDDGANGVIKAQIILTPYIGPKLADKINFNPSNLDG